MKGNIFQILSGTSQLGNTSAVSSLKNSNNLKRITIIQYCLQRRIRDV